MSLNASSIPSTQETGTIGIKHLKRYWSISTAKRDGTIPSDAFTEEWHTDNLLLNTLNIGLEQTIKQLFIERLNFEDFEQWILQVNGGSIATEKINWFHEKLENDQPAISVESIDEEVLSASDVDFWNTNGYVIIRNAVTIEDCNQAIEAICHFLEIDVNDPATWYLPHPAKEGIMVQLFQHPVLQSNRHAARIRKAYEQLWNSKDIIVNIDKTGFNPPETRNWKFPGSGLHWDVSLQPPIPFGLQGILYLSDTTTQQGAFTVVPGFHNIVHEWLSNLPADTDPRNQPFDSFEIRPIAANAGDFIIWHQALPHCASPNKTDKPRFVQYINYTISNPDFRKEWK